MHGKWEGQRCSLESQIDNYFVVVVVRVVALADLHINTCRNKRINKNKSNGATWTMYSSIEWKEKKILWGREADGVHVFFPYTCNAHQHCRIMNILSSYFPHSVCTCYDVMYGMGNVHAQAQLTHMYIYAFVWLPPVERIKMEGLTDFHFGLLPLLAICMHVHAAQLDLSYT